MSIYPAQFCKSAANPVLYGILYILHNLPTMYGPDIFAAKDSSYKVFQVHFQKAAYHSRAF